MPSRVDVPANLAARARLFDTGDNRKTDALDAHSVAVVAECASNLRALKVDAELEALRMLTDRREALTRRRVQTVCRLQALLAEPLPGQSNRDITTGQARAIAGQRSSARHRRQDPPPCRRRAGRADRGEAKSKKATAELKSLVIARGSRLMDIHGVGAVVAARILADVGDVIRFANHKGFSSWTGTARLDASSGEQNGHRSLTSREPTGHPMIRISAVTQLCLDTEGHAYYQRKRAAGKERQEGLRCLKRGISDAMYKQLVADATRRTARYSKEATPRNANQHWLTQRGAG